MDEDDMSPALSRAQVIRLMGLMDMLYLPVEIGERLGVTATTVRKSFLPAGAPFQRDAGGRIWIPGKAFANWARNHLAQKRNKARLPLSQGQGYCLKCNLVVAMYDPRKSKPDNRGVSQIRGTCPVCGGKVNRFIGRGTR